MNREELETKIIELIACKISIEKEDITVDSDFVSKLGFDSLDAVELIMAIEDEFDISIPDSEAELLTSVNNVVNYLQSYMGD